MIYYPEDNIQQIGEFISANNDNKLVVCLCTDWCNNCNDWKNPLIALSEKYPNDFFIWMDIERHSDMVSEVDLDTLPVLLVQKNNDIIFLGAVVPRVNTIIPLLETKHSVMRAYDPGIKQFLLDDYFNSLSISFAINR
ncbi:hypothetical protein LAW87_22620 [Escherichia coli]|nr:hypothetical protein [Escherichia coli]